MNGTTNNDDDSRSHQTGISSSPNGYSIHSLLNHSQYNLHSNEYSIKRSHHHHHHHNHHGSRVSHQHSNLGEKFGCRLETFSIRMICFFSIDRND